MSWLRIDDGFAEHYKIAELNDREFRIWVRTLCYAARNNGRRGILTPAMRSQIMGLNKPLTNKLLHLGLLDRVADEDGVVTQDVEVHDWLLYRVDIAIAEKVDHYLSRFPDASANDVCRAVGGKREIVLAEIHRLRNGSNTGSESGSREPV